MYPSQKVTLNSLITTLPRLGKATANDFAKLGVRTVRDLLFHIPFRHEDFSKIVRAADLKINEPASLRVKLLTIKNSRSPRKHRLYTEAIFEDNSGSIKAVWFNQPYLPKLLHQGDWVFLSGVLQESYFGLHMTNPIFERADNQVDATHAGRLIPIYHTRGRLTSRAIRSLVRTALPLATKLTDWLPKEIQTRNHFPPLAKAVTNAHFPNTTKDQIFARQRLAFDELFLAQLIAAKARAELEATPAPPIPFNESATKTFVDSLPFKLTDDQRKATWAILQDMTRGRPMNRLLEGDVGSGKTVVAAIAILNTALAGAQTLYLAPTEILAHQHAQTLGQLFRDNKINVGLLTQSFQEIDGHPTSRKNVEKAIATGKISCLIGTHTLFQEAIQPKNLGLVIVDEQHRFGVEQRKKLRERYRGDGLPHLLSMTATPIPRTLALTVYSDLDLSQLREMPKGRQTIATTLVTESKRHHTYEMIRAELRAGRQAFVICPLVSESDKLGVKAATKEREALEKIFPEFNIGLAHGRLKGEEKSRVMKDFKDNKIQLLVATAVVEVGIDVPNATIMIIEGAERFGLAQLHQFRGRIGRGSEASHCYIFTDADEARERLLAFERLHDGFALAEKDLELRGPGDFCGTAQSGFPKFRVANFRNIELLKLARREATNLLKIDPDLEQHPQLKDQLMLHEQEIHLE